MKTYRIQALLLIFLSIANLSVASEGEPQEEVLKSEWQSFCSEEHHYKVQFPTETSGKKKRRILSISGNNFTQRSFEQKSVASDGVYKVEIFNLKGGNATGSYACLMSAKNSWDTLSHIEWFFSKRYPDLLEIESAEGYRDRITLGSQFIGETGEGHVYGYVFAHGALGYLLTYEPKAGSEADVDSEYENFKRFIDSFSAIE